MPITTLARVRSIALCTAWLGLAAAGSEAVRAAPEDRAAEAVAAFAGHYVMRGRAYDSLDELEAAGRSARPAAVRIVGCEPASVWAWMAAAHRFDDLPLRLEVREPDVVACGAVPVRARSTSGALPRGVDDAAVRRYWEQRHP